MILSTSLSLAVEIGRSVIDVTFRNDGSAYRLSDPSGFVPGITLDTVCRTQNRAHHAAGLVGDYNVRDSAYSLATIQRGDALNTGRPADAKTLREWLNADHPLTKNLHGLTEMAVAEFYELDEAIAA